MVLNRPSAGRACLLLGIVAGFAIPDAKGQTLFFEDFEGGSDGTFITASPYLWTAQGAYNVNIRNSALQDVDPDGLAVCGHCSDWGKVHLYTKNIGQTLPNSGVYAVSFQMYALTGSNGGNSAHWSSVGFRSSTGIANGDTFAGGVLLTVNDLDNGTRNWNFDPRHVTNGGSSGYDFAQGAFFEENVTAKIVFDMDNNETWATITGPTGSETSTKYPILNNADLDEVALYWGMFNHGSYTADPADVDDIRVQAEIPVVPATRMTVPDTVGLYFESEENEEYRLQHALDPVSAIWLNFGPVITGNGNVMSFHDPAGANADRMYRLRLGMAAPPALGNLILNQPYTYWPTPDYYQSADPGDITQLTDGQTFYGANMWVNPATAGWGEGVNIPAVILFDLGELASLSNLKFYSAGGGGAGVWEVGIRVFTSLDGQSFTFADEYVAPPPPDPLPTDRYGIILQVPLNNTLARHVAIVPMPVEPITFIFVDEMELFGSIPPDPGANAPTGFSITGSTAQELQQVLQGGLRASLYLEDLFASIDNHLPVWPEPQASDQANDMDSFRNRIFDEYQTFDELRLEMTENHRVRAAQVYGGNSLVWEVVPDEDFTMLSYPAVLSPPQTATIHTVVNALEATALGAANLTSSAQSLSVVVSGGGAGAPQITPRVAHFVQSTYARYTPDPLLLTDGSFSIPSGESRIIWLLAESTGATPGTYEFTATVTIGSDVHMIPFCVQLHNVTLTTTTPISTGNWSDLNEGVFPGADAVRDSMLDHRMTMGAASAQALPLKDGMGNVIRPVQSDFTKLDQYLAFHSAFDQVSWFYAFDQHSSRPHRDWFGPAGWMSQEFRDIFGEWLTNFVGHVTAQGRSYNEWYFQMFDETLANEVAQLCSLIKSIDPNVRVNCTSAHATTGAMAHFVAAGMDIFNHHAPLIEYNNAPSGYPTLRSGGRELWLYGAADAKFGGGRERDPLEFFRYMHWTAYHHGAVGVHFWNMVVNNGGASIWGPDNQSQDYWPMVYPNGMAYPALPTGISTSEEAIPSRRWEYVRMGIEDYMLLDLAQQKIDALGGGGAAFQTQLDNLVMTVLVNRDDDRNLFRQKRKELVELVETIP